MTLAQQQERSFARTGTYNSLTVPTSNSYTFSVSYANSTYTLTATPKNGQSSDSCGTMTLNHKTETTAAQANCWR
ncbi:MAG: type IV pilin protein [Aeromonadaceae bacterium]|nr:type IV pilin protein [Aeromonadaceae bacterium]